MSTSGFTPAHILGCSEEEAVRLLQGKRITPGEVESVAVTHYDWWRHLHDSRSYWVTLTQAARILRLSPLVVKRMLDEQRLPHVMHVSGVPLMRRHEIEQLANARVR